MLHTVLNSKIHQATITTSDLYYEGSCTIDQDLLELCNMTVNEQIHVVNINNGARFVTYIIPGDRGSKVIGLNGACARLAQVGDRIIIMSYTQVSNEELKIHKPKVIILNERNMVINNVAEKIKDLVV